MKYFETGKPAPTLSLQPVRLAFKGHLAEVMANHAIESEPFLPTDGYLYILSKAWKQASGSDALNIENLSMVKAIQGDCHDLEAKVEFRQAGEEVRFQVSTSSQSSSETHINARGRILLKPLAASADQWVGHSRDFRADTEIYRRDAASLQSRVGGFITLGAYYNLLERVGTGAEGFIGTLRIQESKSENLATNKSIGACVESLLRYCDYSLGFAGYHVPYSINSVRLTAEIENGVYHCHGRLLPRTDANEPLIADLALVDDSGKIALLLTGIRLIAVNGKKVEPKSGSGKSRHDGIAVIGMSCRFPGATTVDKYWENLCNGELSVTGIPEDRWKGFSDWYDPKGARPGKGYSAIGGFIEGHDRFDPRFFGISPADAEFMDPEQRVFLQEAWKAIENGGYAPAALDGTDCGVFVGCGHGDYDRVLQLHGLAAEGQAFMGSSTAILSARISYFLNLKGPSIALDTACSSSLSAVHMACESLRRGECSSALAGGVTLFNSPKTHVHTAQVGMLSRQGACRPFSAFADGTLCAEGCGVIFLKRLEDALRDGDPIVGVIRGSGTNQDGRTNGITAPSGLSQKALLESIYAKSGIPPSTVSYIECHGTGTPLGDPIEVGALEEVFGRKTEKDYSCALGSVKGNIGHASFAAGIAGLIKVLLCIRHKKLVPTLGFDVPNPHIDFDRLPFYVNTELRRWDANARGERYAAVSSFGFGGTNVHVVVSEPVGLPTTEPSFGTEEGYLVPVSAKTKDSLIGTITVLKEHLKTLAKSEGEVASIRQVAYTLAVSRNAFANRAVFQASSVPELIANLEAFLASGGIRGVSGSETAKSWMAGAAQDWKALFQGAVPQRLNLPGYVFEAQRCWPEGKLVVQASEAILKQQPLKQMVQPGAEIAAKGEAAFEQIRNVLASQLKIRPAEIFRETVLMDLGLDSIGAMKASRAISAALDVELSAATVFGCKTIGDLERILADSLPTTFPVPVSEAPTSATFPTVLGVPDSGPQADRVAILGISCAFPGAADKEAYWNNLRSGKRTIQETPEERLALWRLGKEPSFAGDGRDSAATRWGGYLEDAFHFDPDFFGIPLEEVENMDPQHRLVLTHAYWALEDASIAPKSLAGKKVGVFVAIASDGHQGILEGTDKYSASAATGALTSMAANRLSFVLDVKGPSETVDVACSSSLMAVKKASDALLSGESDLAIVAGVNLILSPFGHHALADAQLLSADGNCKPFSQDSSGFVRSEGVGVLVLGLENSWPGQEAYGLILASSAGHGGRSNSLTAPNPGSQAEVVQAAYLRNGIDPRSIGFLETHGTGTPMGDQVEIEGLKRSFKGLLKGGASGHSEDWKCPLGSVKSQIGHTEIASGMASIVKVLWQFQERVIPGSPSAFTESPELHLERSPFYLPRQESQWTQTSGARRAGVSAFGFGGVNAHLVLEEASSRADARSTKGGGAWIVLSARNKEDLRKKAKGLHDVLTVQRFDLLDVEQTLAYGRDVFPTRLAFYAKDTEACLASLESYLHGRPSKGASILYLSEDHGLDAVKNLGGGQWEGIAREWVNDKADLEKVVAPRTNARRVHLPGYPMNQTSLTPALTSGFSGIEGRMDVPVGNYLEEWAARGKGW